MTIEIKSSWSKRRIVADTYFMVTNVETVTTRPGQSKEITLRCTVPNAQYECY